MPEDPTLGEVIRDWVEAYLLELHTAIPAVVRSYDATRQVAECVPVVRRAAARLDGSIKLTDVPPIQNVPVAWPRGGGYYLHMPLQKGDHVLLIFNESAIAQWRVTGEVSEPGDLARHDLSYPFAIPCCAPDSGAFADAPDSDEAVLAVPDGGVLRINRPSPDRTEFVVMWSKLKEQLSQAITTAISSAGTSDGGAAALTQLASIIDDWTADTIASNALKAGGDDPPP